MNKLIALLKHLLKTGKTGPDRLEAPDSRPVTTAAVPGRAKPRELHRGRKRLKENYTSHWDLDYLPREEMEKIIAESERKSV